MDGIALLWNFTGKEGRIVQYKLKRMLFRKDLACLLCYFLNRYHHLGTYSFTKYQLKLL